ncbi:hypothetical protein Tco_0872083 [Tanacetum coccineum]
MSTPAYVDSKTITQANKAQSSRVPVPLPDDPYVAVRHAQLVDTNTESDREEAPSEVEELLLETARMAVRTQPTLSLGISARIAEASALSPSSFCKRYRSSYETSSSSTLTLPGRKRYRDDDRESQGLGDEDHGLGDESQGLKDEGFGLEEEEVVPEGQQQAVQVMETAASEPLRLGYKALRRRELAVEEDHVPSTFEVGQSSRSVLEHEGVERILSFRQPTLVTWVDPEDDRVYADVLAYAPPAAPVQTLSSPEWSLGSLPVSLSSPIVPSPIASPVATSAATISVDEDQFIESCTLGQEWLDEIFSQRHVDTQLENTSRDRYDDHILIDDIFVQHAAMQHELQE